MRVSTETSHFYLDLVFYHHVLKCFVIIDLKTTKLTHQDIGQIDMYVRMFDDLKRGTRRQSHHRPKLRPQRQRTTKYRTVLPTEAELERERRVIEQKRNGGDT